MALVIVGVDQVVAEVQRIAVVSLARSHPKLARAGERVAEVQNCASIPVAVREVIPVRMRVAVEYPVTDWSI